MTRQQLDGGLAELKAHFPGQAPYSADEYFDALEEITNHSWRRTIDRARAEFSEMPTPKHLLAVFHDLTYWDVPRFFDDWGAAYFACTGEDYWFGFTWPIDPNFRPDTEHIAKREAEEMYWLNRRPELQKAVIRKGGKRAVQRELTELVDTGNLVGRTLTEYLRGENFRYVIQLGWRKPNLPTRIPRQDLNALIREVEKATEKRSPKLDIEARRAELRRQAGGGIT